MIVDITKLKQNIVEQIKITEEVKFDAEILKETEIKDLKNVTANGYIYTDDLGDYELNLIVSGTMVLPDSITLEPVDYDFTTEISGDYKELMSEMGEIAKNIDFSLDIFPIIWENILMEIPIKVTGPEATDLKLSGDGWKLVTEESDEQVTNAFDKLKDLL
ncbi:MAG: DUF177 domain-containing protein [Bacilli bacterium]